MGILYQASDPMVWAIWLFVVFALMAFNEFGRTSVWGGVALFVVAPVVFTIFVWPHTAAPGNEYGTGNWFNWAKTYSALAGCVGFMTLRFVKWRGADGRVHHLYEKRWALCFPPLILAINICEAVVRDVLLRPVGWRRRRPRMDDIGPLEHHERHRGHPEHHHHLRLVRNLHLEGQVA